MTGSMKDCVLCPRECHADREGGERGYCGMEEEVYAARAALHMWEEPCISGERGSGAVFFSGCSLRCVYCQNREIALGKRGIKLSRERLAEIFLNLQHQGAANLNLVTAGHFVPQTVAALELARSRGFRLPVVYNSGGYEKAETLRMLEGYVDVYLPDFKYAEPELAAAFSNAPDYPRRASAAIEEMLRQTGPCVFDPEGYIVKGTIVRHLILPGHTRNSVKALRFLLETFGRDLHISILKQYTPVCKSERFPELNRTVTRREYEKVLNAALEMGLKNGYFQESGTAKESFIPDFDYEGLLEGENFPEGNRQPPAGSTAER